MRVAMVSPYEWTLPGGVNRHVEGLSRELLRRGHEVRVFAPASRIESLPAFLTPLGRTVPLPFNGARSNLTLSPAATQTLRDGLRSGFDVVHLHEPVAPIGHRRSIGLADVPVVGTFHAYSERMLPHAFAAAVGSRRLLNRLHVRIAVSEPAAWTGQRFYGGDYRIVPNGVDVPPGGPPPQRRTPGEPLRIAFVGQPVERKGLPLLLRAFEALRNHVPARLTVIGAEPAALDALLVDPRGVVALGRVSDAEKRAVLEDAHVLCAPSLGGESFGIVLAEAFAAGTTVVASDIAGYRSVVTPGRDGVLVEPGDATALAVALRDLAAEPERLARLATGARAAAQRYAWPTIADDVLEAYEDARAVTAPDTRAQRAALRLGLRPADGGPRRPPRRLPSLDHRRPTGRERALRAGRRAAAAGGIGLAVAGTALAMHRLGWHRVGASIVRSSPAWVLAAIGLMVLSMLLRAVSWHAVLRAAHETRHARLRDALQGTAIGVLMSATLPARLGEVSRALIVARRLGRPRERMPTVLGTMVSQTALNVLTLVLLGALVASHTGVLATHQRALLAYGAGPLVVVAAVLVAPALLASGRRRRVGGWVTAVQSALVRVRSGLAVFRRPALGGAATVAQLSAWALQASACAVLLQALDLDPRGAGIVAGGAVLFAVNVSAILPVTPSNLGVFQAACVAVLTSGYHVPAADAFAYGIILQAVELATAVIVGTPALLREGSTWREVRRRALHSTPVQLAPGAAPDASRA